MFGRRNVSGWKRAGTWLTLLAGLGGCGGPDDFLDAEDGETLPGQTEQVEKSQHPVVDGSHNTASTDWSWHTGQTAAQVDALIRSGYRLVSVQVESASPLRFTIAAVRNTGSHAQTSWWFHSMTASQLDSVVASVRGRIVDIHAYTVSGSTRFAAIVVLNTGAKAKNWWWAHGKTPQEIDALVQANQARPIDLQSYTENGSTKYTAVLIQNTGADGTGWWWYFARTSPQVDAAVRQTGGCLTSINRTPDDKFDVLLTPCNGTFWEWWNGYDAAQVSARAEATGTRVQDIKALGGGRFVTILVDNADAETTRIRSILRRYGNGGEVGFMVKRIAGAIERSLNIDYAFDPASSIKALVAVHTMRGMEHGAFSLATPIDMYKPGLTSCPSNTLTGAQESMGDALRAMLVQSDNQRTKAFIDLFSMPAIEQASRDMGLEKVRIVDYPGCSGFANRWSLRDGSRLYEGVMNGSLISANSRTALFARMPADGGDSSGALWALREIAAAEAPSFGLTTAQVAAFNDRLKTHYKAGHHWNPLPWEDVENLSISGIARIPACSGASIVYRDYVWGAFIHDAEYPYGDYAFDDAKVEPLRQAVRASLSNFRTCAP